MKFVFICAGAALCPERPELESAVCVVTKLTVVKTVKTAKTFTFYIIINIGQN